MKNLYNKNYKTLIFKKLKIQTNGKISHVPGSQKLGLPFFFLHKEWDYIQKWQKISPLILYFIQMQIPLQYYLNISLAYFTMKLTVLLVKYANEIFK